MRPGFSHAGCCACLCQECNYDVTNTFRAPAQLPSGQRQAVPYLLTTLPPFLLALAFPALFFSALDFAGCYGVLTLFGLLPVAMAWSERYQVGLHLNER